MIEVKGLVTGYPGQTVLTGVDLTVPDGKITIIVGPNGCGKSTLLKAIMGMLPVQKGQICIGGRDISGMSVRELAQQAAYLAQSKPVPEITALRMVLHGRFPYLSYPRRYRPADWALARQVMEQLGIGSLQDRMMQTLSGGTRQKVYLAMALAQDTPAILMDEPTTFLDISYQLQVMQSARLLANMGKAVVMVLHDLSLALKTADQLAVLDQGRIVQCGDPQQIWESKCLDQVFGITVRQFQTEHGPQYYYEPQ